MAVGSLDLKTVSLRYGVLILKQQKDMTLFQITHQELYYKNASNTEEGLQMLMRLKRKVMSIPPVRAGTSHATTPPCKPDPNLREDCTI